MDKLINGVKIYTNLEKEDRVYVSNGTKEVNILNDLPCKRRTFVPNAPWRVPDAYESNLIFASDGQKNSYQIVGVVKVDKLIEHEIINSGVSSIPFSADSSYSCSKKIDKVLESISNFSKKYQIIDEQQIFTGLSIVKGSTDSLTWNNKDNSFIGLHLDSWEDNVPLNLRHISRNRICFNLGTEDRFLLFLNLPITQLADFAEQNNYKNVYNIFEKFFTENPNYPILKIRIKPFEAYIAPTEYIVHDGCNSAYEITDIKYTLRSYYGVNIQ